MKWTVPGLVVIIAALAIALAVKSWDRPDDPKIPPGLQKTIDSLEATRRPSVVTRDSIIRLVVHDTVRAAGSSARGDSAARAAAASQVRADSLAALARVSADSATLWHSAYDAQRQTSDSLRVAVAAKDSAYRAERDARAKLLLVVRAATIRMNAIQDANDRLVKRIGELETPCKIIGPIRCPSRTMTMLITAATIVGIDARLGTDLKSSSAINARPNAIRAR